MPYTLAYKDRFKRVPESRIESDTSDSIAFPYMADNEDNRFIAVWTGKQFTKLFSALYTGANLMFPDEANEIIWQLLKVVHKPETLEDEDEDGCVNFKPYAPFISYEPMNPYNHPDEVPEGYLSPPFIVNTAFEYPEIMGYQATDVMVPISSITAPDSWEDLVSLPFPTIKIRVYGVGQVELDLLQVQNGGRAIIKVGSPPNILDLIDGIIETGVTVVELGQDITSIPPESDIISSQEIEINAPDGTDLYIVFVPAIDISTEFFNHGGGLRQIGLCGLETEGATMGIEDLRFDPTFRLQKRILGEWVDIEGAETFESAIQAIQLTANKGYAGALQLIGLSADASYPEVTWLGSAHHAQHEYLGEMVARVFSIAESLRDTTELVSPYSDTGFIGSLLQAYIDAAGEDFDPSSIEADIEALETAVALAQSTADGAVSVNTAQNTRLDNIEADIDVLDGRLDALEAVQLHSFHWDFKADNFDFAEGFPATWVSGQGFTFEDDMVIDKASSGLADGRIVSYRLELRRITAGEANYTSELVGDLESYGKLESGLNIHYHKVGNMAIQNDFEIELTCDTGEYALEGLTVFFFGNALAFDD